VGINIVTLMRHTGVQYGSTSIILVIQEFKEAASYRFTTLLSLSMV